MTRAAQDNDGRNGVYLNAAGQLCVVIDGQTTYFNLSVHEAMFLASGLFDFVMASTQGGDVESAMAIYADHAGSA